MYPSAMVVAATPRMACSGRAVGTSFYLPCVYRRVVGFDRDPCAISLWEGSVIQTRSGAPVLS